MIFEEQSNVANLIHKIMMHTQAILQCARCQVLLVKEACKVSQGVKVIQMHAFHHRQ